MIFALLALCEGNPPVTGGFPSQRVSNVLFMLSFDLACISCWKKSRYADDLGDMTLMWRYGNETNDRTVNSVEFKHIDTETKWLQFRRRNFKRIFLNQKVLLCIPFSSKFVLKGLSNNESALVQIISWRRSGDNQLSEPMVGNFTDGYGYVLCPFLFISRSILTSVSAAAAHWYLSKIADILPTTFGDYCCKKIHKFYSVKFVSKGPINKKSLLI